MANLFVLNLADRQVAPVAADKNANALIARAVALLAGDADVPTAPEPIDVDARRAALFGEVTSGALSMDEAVAALKALDAEVVAAAKAAKADPACPAPGWRGCVRCRGQARVPWSGRRHQRRGRFARWRAHRHDHHVSGLSP
jgi:hypothetical protein